MKYNANWYESDIWYDASSIIIKVNTIDLFELGIGGSSWQIIKWKLECWHIK